MAAWSSLSAGARAAAMAGGAAVVAAAGWLVWPGAAPDPVSEPVVASTEATAPDPAAAEPVAPAPETSAPATQVPETQVPAADPVPAAVQPAAPEPASVDAAAPDAAVADPAGTAATAAEPPRFDLVRVEPDGTATVAGRAAPGAVVSLRIDGTEVAQATADGQGSFAALLTLPASAAPRLMSLATLSPEGAEVQGPDTVALAATVAAAAPVAEQPAVAPVAEAAPVVEGAPVVEAPAALLLTEGGVKVLQPGTDVPAELVANVSIDTITYAPDGAVLLGGRGSGFVRVYLDDIEAVTVQGGADGQWSATLADVAPGIYTLRADQIGADGKVTSRFETPFKRETLQALAAVAIADVAPQATTEAAPLAEPAAEPATVSEPAAEVAAAVETTAVAEPVQTDAAEAAPVVAAPVEPSPDSSTAPAETVLSEPLVAPEPIAATQPAPVSVTVQPGFTLWGIAQQNFGDGVMYVQVFEANKDKIRDPDLIYPGQVFTIPTP